MGVWRHENKCSQNTIIEEDTEQIEEVEVSKPHSSANILIELVKQNKELMSSNQEFKESSICRKRSEACRSKKRWIERTI